MLELFTYKTPRLVFLKTGENHSKPILKVIKIKLCNTKWDQHIMKKGLNFNKFDINLKIFQCELFKENLIRNLKSNRS